MRSFTWITKTNVNLSRTNSTLFLPNMIKILLNRWCCFKMNWCRRTIISKKPDPWLLPMIGKVISNMPPFYSRIKHVCLMDVCQMNINIFEINQTLGALVLNQDHKFRLILQNQANWKTKSANKSWKSTILKLKAFVAANKCSSNTNHPNSTKILIQYKSTKQLLTKSISILPRSASRP